MADGWGSGRSLAPGDGLQVELERLVVFVGQADR